MISPRIILTSPKAQSKRQHSSTPPSPSVMSVSSPSPLVSPPRCRMTSINCGRIITNHGRSCDTATTIQQGKNGLTLSTTNKKINDNKSAAMQQSLLGDSGSAVSAPASSPPRRWSDSDIPASRTSTVFTCSFADVCKKPLVLSPAVTSRHPPSASGNIDAHDLHDDQVAPLKFQSDMGSDDSFRPRTKQQAPVDQLRLFFPNADRCSHCVNEHAGKFSNHQSLDNALSCPNFLRCLIKVMRYRKSIKPNNQQYQCCFSNFCRSSFFSHEENNCPVRESFRGNLAQRGHFHRDKLFQITHMLRVANCNGKELDKFFRLTLAHNSFRAIHDFDQDTQTYTAAGCVFLVSDTSVAPTRYHILFGDRFQSKRGYSHDLPKGKRKGINETPFVCALREAREELTLDSHARVWADDANPTTFNRLDFQTILGGISCFYGIPFMHSYDQARAMVDRYNNPESSVGKHREFHKLTMLSLKDIFQELFCKRAQEPTVPIYKFIKSIFDAIDECQVLQTSQPVINNRVDLLHSATLQHTNSWSDFNEKNNRVVLDADFDSDSVQIKFQQFQRAITQFCSVKQPMQPDTRTYLQQRHA